MFVALALYCVAALAGFVDAIAGGGGMITLPVLLFTGIPPHMALGTNKAQSLWGSGAALLRYSRATLLSRHRIAWTASSAFAGALVGAGLVSVVSSSHLRPVILTLLLGVAVFMLVYRIPKKPQPPKVRSDWLVAAVALLIGAYDGFFGPGTGTFLIMSYALLWRDPLDVASANAKVANFASNVASFLLFAAVGAVHWSFVVPMALGQVTGGWLGAHVTVRSGAQLVRVVVVLVSLAVVARLIWGN